MCAGKHLKRLQWYLETAARKDREAGAIDKNSRVFQAAAAVSKAADQDKTCRKHAEKCSRRINSIDDGSGPAEFLPGADEMSAQDGKCATHEKYRPKHYGGAEEKAGQYLKKIIWSRLVKPCLNWRNECEEPRKSYSTQAGAYLQKPENPERGLGPIINVSAAPRSNCQATARP